MITVEARPDRVVDERLGGTTTEREAAFARLVDHDALDHAYRFATLMLGDREEAEDAAHDAALTAWRHLDELREPARFEAWFARILSNTCRDRLRARGRVRLLHVSPDAFARTSAAIGDSADVIALHQALAGALNELPPDQREVVVLRYFFDLPIEQIAARTGAHAGTVKSRLHYALRALRGAFDAASRREDIR
jgi:RNA polymerase sigma-70 factor, ECF subfamily